MAVARYFDKSKLEKGVALPFGVPMRDLTVEELAALPEHVQRSIDTWPVFRKTKPPAAQPAAPADEKETT